MTVHSAVIRLLSWLPTPLDPVRSIKAKLSLALGFAGGAGLLVFLWSIDFYRVDLLWIAIAAALGLVTLQVMAHGATVPLREMTVAARAMARGDYTRRIRTRSRDEVGELASAFNQMAADLAAADQQRRELIANVSHELRTPITALQGLLENIVDGVAEPEPAAMSTALAQTQRLSRLVTDLLDLSRLDAGVVPLRQDVIDVPEFLDDAVREAAMNAGPDVRFAVSAPGMVISGDRERLHQVLANLLDNAARHSPPGGTVTVRAERRDEHLLLAVVDQGVGIPAAERERVFERFTRGERAAGGGTGLGLAIARWVVQMHRGSIAVVEPDGDRGCHIQVRLPLHPCS
ncbi:putative two-component system sensor kinase [Actinoplanes missouriensis 431]|uniref:histidine kinase n=1 Tax=Actinoplanes missouriensis (strain ATCC 14538 / DSM 43046 / CBS 188.64 / JCM 3121 / NBRC 102363 / NCIMB 12654 / NRRL B-3342 / UNCC 431) TaxID=512565 RepID=I0HJQ9_ACTM4|nr:HAMP domain-containing sensor histidine kinase [Actinoplanes missouriensis]BAL93246.1 putative two-component system sensor kinase [Actinoplanes missouriensis 431]